MPTSSLPDFWVIIALLNFDLLSVLVVVLIIVVYHYYGVIILQLMVGFTLCPCLLYLIYFTMDILNYLF